MKVKIYKTRDVSTSDSNIGTRLEDGATTFEFEFPETITFDGVEYSTDELTKIIVFRTSKGSFFRPIEDNKYTLKLGDTQESSVAIQMVMLKPLEEGEDIQKNWASNIASIYLGERIEGIEPPIPPEPEYFYVQSLNIPEFRYKDGNLEFFADGEWRTVSGGGGSSDLLWKPNVDANGNISWIRSSSATAPTPQNIKGPQGLQGIQGIQGIQGEKGLQGNSGKDGANGVDGKTPIKGTDYFTETDINEIVEETLSRIPVDTTLQARLGGV